MIQSANDLTSFKWGTIKDTDPLAVQLDGDTAPLALIPDSLLDPALLVVGDRVRVELSKRKVVIHGKSGGLDAANPPPLPAPITIIGPTQPAATTVTTFENIPGMASAVLTLSDPAWVRIDMQAIIGDNVAYTMLGVTISGATTLAESETNMPGGTASSGLTPFGYSSGELYGHKLVYLNAGVNTITMRRRRNAASGTHITNYPILSVTVEAWAGTPGAVAADTGWVDLASYITGGFTASAGAIEGRRRDEHIELRGLMSAPAVSAANGSIDFMTAIPTLFRPTKRIGWGTGYGPSGIAYPAFCRTDGTMGFGRGNALLAGTTQFTIKFFAG